MRFFTKKPLRFLLVLTGLFIFYLFAANEVSAQVEACSPPGNIIGACGGANPGCWDQLRIDVYQCNSDGVGGCDKVVVFGNPNCEDCVAGGCQTVTTPCGSSDSCDCVRDIYGFCIIPVDCGWNGTTAGGAYAPACGTKSCCGPGPEPTSPPPSTPAPTPVPSCTTTLSPTSPSTFVGNPVAFTASVAVGAGSVDRVDFSSSNLAVSTVSPASDITSPFNTTADAISSGSTTITADVVMGGVVRCSDSEILTVSAVSCTVAFGSPSYDVDAGLTTVVSASGTPSGGTIDEYEFTIGSTSVATICFFGTGPCAPGSGSVVGASSIIDLTGVFPSPPTTTITATARMLDEGASCTTFVPSTVTVNNPSSWWQVKEGDAVTDGAISSTIPPTAYENYLIVHDALGEYPGVATFRGSLNPNPPDISSTNWNADSAYSGTIPNYTFFEGRVSQSSFTNIITNPANTTVLTTGPLVNGYLWLRYDGAGYGNAPLVIEDPLGTVNLGTNKVVLFVKNANLEIKSKIRLTPGQGFFMAISERNIIVDPTVGGAHDVNPDLEGIYIADQEVRTGAGTQQLHVRGSVVGNQGVQLERIPTDNSLYPAELFEYAVDQMMLFPGDLTPNRIQWREVAP